jgi:hypothetical protein
VHALRHVHQLLAPGGTLVDIHPVAEEEVEAAGRPVGVISEPDWLTGDLPNSEAALRQVIARGCTNSRRRRSTTCYSTSTILTN